MGFEHRSEYTNGSWELHPHGRARVHDNKLRTHPAPTRRPYNVQSTTLAPGVAWCCGPSAEHKQTLFSTCPSSCVGLALHSCHSRTKEDDTTRGRVYLFQHRQRMEHLHRRTPIRMCPKHLTLLLDTGPSPASFCGTAKTRKHSEPSLRPVYPYMFDTLQHAGHCLRITSTTVVQLLDTPLREHPSSPPTARGRSLTRQNDPPTSRAQGLGATIIPKTVHVAQHSDMTPKRNIRRKASDSHTAPFLRCI